MSKHEDYLHMLSPLVIEHQGTRKGLTIKKMYFQVLQTQLYGENPNIEVFSEKDVLDMIYGGGSLEADFDSQPELIREV